MNNFDIKQYWELTSNDSVPQNLEPKFYLTYTLPKSNVTYIFHDGSKVLSRDVNDKHMLDEFATLLMESGRIDQTQIIKVNGI